MSSAVNANQHILVGGLEHFLSFHILGILIPTDQYFSEWLKPPTSYVKWPYLQTNPNRERFCRGTFSNMSEEWAHISVTPSHMSSCSVIIPPLRLFKGYSAGIYVPNMKGSVKFPSNQLLVWVPNCCRQSVCDAVAEAIARHITRSVPIDSDCLQLQYLGCMVMADLSIVYSQGG
jgi:hypothetical protein